MAIEARTSRRAPCPAKRRGAGVLERGFAPLQASPHQRPKAFGNRHLALGVVDTAGARSVVFRQQPGMAGTHSRGPEALSVCLTSPAPARTPTRPPTSVSWNGWPGGGAGRCRTRKHAGRRVSKQPLRALGTLEVGCATWAGCSRKVMVSKGPVPLAGGVRGGQALPDDRWGSGRAGPP